MCGSTKSASRPRIAAASSPPSSTSFFERYVEYGFTADLENKLDDISGGKIAWRKVLEDFWRDFTTAVDGTKDLTISQVIDALDEGLGPHFFPPLPDGRDARLCPVCSAGRLGLKLGRFGAFIGCSNYPNCRYTRPLAARADGRRERRRAVGPRELGLDPDTDLPVSLRKGPYGIYVQLGTAKRGTKPKRISLPKGMTPNECRSSWRSGCCRCRARSGRIPRTASRSSPASAASAPMCATARSKIAGRR